MANKLGLLILLSGMLLCVANLWAIDRDGALDDPALQARFETLTTELRCLVCQNQTIADSNADLANDLREQVRTMLLAGRSDQEILIYMTDRYGDFVLYRPSFSAKNWLLWGAPFLFLAFGIVAVVRAVRKQASLPDALSTEPTEPTEPDQS